MTDKVNDKGFMGRWSTRKAEANAGLAVDPTDEIPPIAEELDQTEEPQPQLTAEDLPDVETLNAESDYTAFLGDNVPQDLTKMALRKLWRSDPILANIDGLNDYDEDFSKAGLVGAAVKTAYRVGKGLLTDEDIAKNNGEAPEQPPIVEGGEDETSDFDSLATEDADTSEGDQLPLTTSSLAKPDVPEFHDVEIVIPDKTGQKS